MRRLFVSPSDFKSKIATYVLDDGSDVEIIFTSGEYDWTSFLIDKRSGGKLVMRAQNEHEAIITGGGFTTTAAFFCSTDITLVDLYFLAHPYPTYTAFTEQIGVNCGALSANGVKSCDPSFIHFENLKTHGDRIDIRAHPSRDSALYTSVLLKRLRATDNGHNGLFQITGLNNNCYAHVRADDIYTHGINGPDGFNWTGETTTSNHVGGTLGVEFFDLAGSSTVHFSNWVAESEIQGSANHDAHNFRINKVNGSDVYFRFRDCHFSGLWSANHCTGDGSGLTHLGYYHPGGPNYPTDRPLLEWENCKFEFTIGPNVATEEAASDQPKLRLFVVGSDANYHLWDCLFSWDIQRPEFEELSRESVHFWNGADPADIYLHNCTQVNCSPGTPVGAATLTVDSRTRGFVDRTYRRTYALTPVVT
jgi:hypothetical protein